jgi:ACS family tartrate transporter-like MFS transporter
MADPEQTRKKASRRILPFLFVLYVIAYLDRANVSFTRIPMMRELGFSDAAYGFGAGIFFAGYFLLEIPGALIVERWGARRWIARILVTWGAVAALCALVRTPVQFYAARFFLGVAEAGFFPGILVYLAKWFGKNGHSRALAGFVMASPVALLIGGPLSGLILLHVNWFGLGGWRWVFILQGIPAILLGFVTWRHLADSPQQAAWLNPAEKAVLQQNLDRERALHAGGESWLAALRNPNVLLFCAAHACLNIAGYGFIFWLPGTLKSALRVSPELADAASALPYVFAVFSIWLAGRSSDRTGRWKLHACAPVLGAAFFFGLSSIPSQPPALVLLWLCLTASGVFSWIPGFWTLQSSLSTGPARAASIGLINSVGNLGGFAGPAIAGSLLTRTHSPYVLTILVSLFYCLAAGLIVLVKVRPPALPPGAPHAPLR